MRRPVLALALSILSLVPASAASAAAGPPADVGAPGIVYDKYDPKVAISKDVACPGGQPRPLAVTGTFGGATKVATLTDPCAGTWSDASFYGENGFGLDGAFGFTPDYSSNNFVDPPEFTTVEVMPTWDTDKAYPGLITVTDSAGTVVSRRALTIEALSGGRIEQGSDAYVNVCINGDHTITSVNGVLGCYVGPTYLVTKGWPKPEPKPKPPTLSRTAAVTYAKRSISQQFKYRSAPSQRRVSCKKRTPTDQRCQASWSDSKYRYRGTIRIFTVLVRGAGEWHYKMDLTRTDRRSGKTKKIHVA
jgi:hypothetical protein